MSMEMVAWHSMYRAANDHQEQRPFSMATLRRIAAFARPHRRRLAAFLVVSVVGAVLAVAIPVLAGRVVDAIVNGGPLGAVVAAAARGSAVGGARRRRLRLPGSGQGLAGVAGGGRSARSRAVASRSCTT